MAARTRNSKNVLKICILGEGGVGKTTLTRRIITGTFDSKTKMTIGVDFHLLKTSIFDPLANEFSDNVPQIPIQAQIWDFAGEERFRFMLPRYCKGAVGGLILYDITRYSTTNYIDEWFSIWKDNAPHGSPLLLVATKSDLIAPEREEKAMETIIELAERLDIPNFYTISSLDGKNIHVLTNDLLISAYKFNDRYLKEQGF